MKIMYGIYTLILSSFLLSGCNQHGDQPVEVEMPTVTIKDVIIDEVDEAGGVISVSYGEKEKPTKLVNIPLANDVRVVASYVLPGSMNHLPFRWEYVKNLQRKTVSIRLRIESTGLFIVSIASGND